MVIYFSGNFRKCCLETWSGIGSRAAVLKVLSAPYNIVVLAVVLSLAAFSLSTIVPAAPAGLLRYGVAGYCAVISLMLLTAMFQRKFLVAAGAALFVFSDMVLGWNRFVSPVEGSHYLVMVPYYLGQILMFAGASRLKVVSND